MSDLDIDTRTQSTQGKLIVGTVLDDRYEVIAFLGSGGMCSVYKAQDRLLSKPVAIKLLHSHLTSDADARRRFKREGMAIASLKHANIVQVFGVGSWDGQPYISMEFLDGKSLSALLKETGPLPAKRAINFFVQICDAIGHAHDLGVVHRDLKPSNVMVFENEQLKLVDFGIAKLLPDSGKDIQKLTQTGELFGTLAYMSPEQCMGKEVTQASDIFSFGCLMYELLEGKPPLVGATAFETMHKRVTESPDTTNLGNLAPIILACLAQAPEQRPASMKAIRSALLDPTSFQPNKKIGTTKWKLNRKNLLAASVIVFGITSFVTAGLVVSTKMNEKPVELDFHMIGRTGEVYMERGDYKSAIPHLRQAAELGKRHLEMYPGQDPRHALQLQQKLGRCLISVGQFDDASGIIKDVIHRFPKHEDHDPTYFDALDSLGELYSAKKDPQAIHWRQELLAYIYKSPKVHLRDVGQLRLGQSYCDVGQHLKAIPILEPLVEKAKQVENVDLYTGTIAHLGRCYILRSAEEKGVKAQADYDAGIKLLNECLTFDRANTPQGEPKDATDGSVEYAKTLLEAFSSKTWNPKFRN